MELKNIDPHEIIDLNQWQSMVNLLCRLAAVKSAAITRVDQPEIEAFIVSDNQDNPLHQGLRVELAHHYCQAVIDGEDILVVPNALESERWSQAPEIEKNWSAVESYIKKYSRAQFSHSICPECSQKLYPDIENIE